MSEHSLVRWQSAPESGDLPRLQPKAWHVLWTRSNCEKLVRDQLAARGYETFLPMLDQWLMNRGHKRVTSVPMFKSYVFINHAVGKHDYIDISRTKGVVRILGARWDNLAVVSDDEVDAIRMTIDSKLPVTPFHYLARGDRVRVISGPLAGIEGIYVTSDPTRGMFVVSVDLLQRSVALEIDCTRVVPV